MASGQGDRARYGEENGVVFDKWIFGVCGEEGLQFPAHRRRQFPAYLEHARFVSKQNAFVAGTFSYPSRAGPREVLTLQYTLEALGDREKAWLKQLHQVENNIAHVKATLEEKTMGMSALPPSAFSRTPTPLPDGSSQAHQHEQRVVADGYQSLSAVSPLTARGEDRRARYAEKKNIAARYMEQKRDEMRHIEADQRDVFERHEKLKAEEEQLRKECHALKETEDIVLARQTETEQHLAAIRERVEVERQRAATRRDEHDARLTAAMKAITTQGQAPNSSSSNKNGRRSTFAGHAPQQDAAAQLEFVTPATDVPLVSADDGERSSSPILDTIDLSEETELAADKSRVDVEEEEEGDHEKDINAMVSSSSSSSSGDPHEGQEHAHAEAISPTEAGPSAEAGLGMATAPAAGAEPLVCTPPSPPATSDDCAPPVASEEARVALLERLRYELSDSGARRQELLRSLRNESQVHIGRLRQSRQRLKDWQDIVESQRRVADQLNGQVRVLTRVVEDTTNRLEAADVANRGGVSGGYAGQLSRLNDLLKQRTMEHYQAYTGSTEGSAAEAESAAAAEQSLLRPFQRPAPGASGFNTPARRGSQTNSTHTPTRAAPAAAGQSTPGQTHRSRYDLVRHLQRWERALVAERAQLRQAVGLHGDTGASEATVGRRDSYKQLRAMLLQA